MRRRSSTSDASGDRLQIERKRARRRVRKRPTVLRAGTSRARRVVGVDIDPQFGQDELERQSAKVARRLQIVRTDGSLRELGSERFDLVFSEDSFEHFDEPERVVHTMIDVLAPGGPARHRVRAAWKAPSGGHMEYMAKVPWAHLLLPEDVIMAERRGFRPDEAASRFEEIKGGVNKMTLARSAQIMSTGLTFRW